MSTIYVPNEEPVDMRSVGFMPKFDDELRPIKTPEKLVVVHELNVPLEEKMVYKVGKTAEQLSKELRELEAKGFYRQSEDFEKFRLLEKRDRPAAAICEVKREQIKELSTYVNGEQLYGVDGTFQNVSPAHPRTWTVGNGNPLTGLEVELDFNKVKKNFEDSGKFSRITPCTWDEMKKMP